MNRKIITIFFLILLFVLAFTLISINFKNLGFFADDISVLYDLSIDSSLKSTIYKIYFFDAGRFLQLIFMNIFFKISNLIDLSFIHIIQILFYLLNSIFLVLILNFFKIDKGIIICIWSYFIFFSLNSEVVYWTHNLGMVLMSSFFFLAYLLTNLKLSTIFKLKKNIRLEIYSILFFVLSVFTYEQYIYALLLIPIIRAYIYYEKKSKIYSYIIFTNYILFTLFFTLFKIFEMKKLNLNINYDFNNILNNIINTTIKPFYEIFYLDKIYYFSKLEYFCFILILFTILIIIRRLKKIDYQNDFKLIEIKNYIKLIIISILLYYSSISPLFLHYLSPRHFYIPMFFFMIGLSFFLTIINNLNIFKKKIYKFVLIFLYLILFTNTFIKFENNKYNQINNFNLKENFYKNIKDEFKNYSKINLINFPILFNDYNLFAHESPYSMRFFLNEKNLPMIHMIEKQKIEEISKDEGFIEFVNISDGKINYKIYK